VGCWFNLDRKRGGVHRLCACLKEAAHEDRTPFGYSGTGWLLDEKGMGAEGTQDPRALAEPCSEPGFAVASSRQAPF